MIRWEKQLFSLSREPGTSGGGEKTARELLLLSACAGAAKLLTMKGGKHGISTGVDKFGEKRLDREREQTGAPREMPGKRWDNWKESLFFPYPRKCMEI